MQGLVGVRQSMLIAVSGGSDSMALGWLMHHYAQQNKHIRFAVAHAYFGLRREAKQEVNFVRTHAQRWKVPFYTQDFSKQIHQSKTSVQMQARHLRYTWFLNLCHTKNYEIIATAHHNQDNLETFLLNLLRGTGLKGLCGIPSYTLRENNIALIRPLLLQSPSALQAYLTSHHYTWCEDTSNTQKKYQRNRLRHELISTLKHIAPAFLPQTFATILARLKYNQALTHQATQAFAKKYKQTNPYYDQLTLPRPLNDANKALLCETLQSYNTTWKLYTNLVTAIETEHIGACILTKTHKISVDRQSLSIETAKRANPMRVHIQIKNLEKQHNIEQFCLQKCKKPSNFANMLAKKGSSEAFVTYEKLTYPLVWRTHEIGDIFYPMGLKGKKKLSDLMIDNKIPLTLKKYTRVLCQANGTIICALLHQAYNKNIAYISSKYCVRPNTQHILHLYPC